VAQVVLEQLHIHASNVSQLAVQLSKLGTHLQQQQGQMGPSKADMTQHVAKQQAALPTSAAACRKACAVTATAANSIRA
jgi:hypothetical protein